MKRSWPFLAWASDAARVLRSTRLMWSTTTLVLCFSPHCLAKVPSNQVSYAGTKWVHCKILSVCCCAAARSGNRNAGPSDPAAMPPAPAILMKSLRDTPLPFFSLIIPSSGHSASHLLFVALLGPRKPETYSVLLTTSINALPQNALRLQEHLS